MITIVLIVEKKQKGNSFSFFLGLLFVFSYWSVCLFILNLFKSCRISKMKFLCSSCSHNKIKDCKLTSSQCTNHYATSWKTGEAKLDRPTGACPALSFYEYPTPCIRFHQVNSRGWHTCTHVQFPCAAWRRDFTIREIRERERERERDRDRRRSLAFGVNEHRVFKQKCLKI